MDCRRQGAPRQLSPACQTASLSAPPAGRFLGPPHIVVRVTGHICNATVASSAARRSTLLFIARTPRPRTPGGRPPLLTSFDSPSRSRARLPTIINSGVSESCSSGSCGKRMAWVASAVRSSCSCLLRSGLTAALRADSLNSCVGSTTDSWYASRAMKRGSRVGPKCFSFVSRSPESRPIPHQRRARMHLVAGQG